MMLAHAASLIGAIAALVAALGTALNYRSLARARAVADAQRTRIEDALNGGMTARIGAAVAGDHAARDEPPTGGISDVE